MIAGMLEELVCCQEMSAELLDDDKNPFWNLAAESVEAAIRSHPIGSAKFSFELV